MSSSARYYIQHDIDGRFLRFNKSKIDICLSKDHKKPSYFCSAEEARNVIVFLQEFCDNEDAALLSVKLDGNSV